MKNAGHNQDPNHYSREYYLNSCAGSADFKLGENSHHLLYLYIFNTMKIEVSNKNILDLGCGRGELCVASMRKGAREVLGLDFSQDAIELANENLLHSADLKNKNISFIQGNALELNLNKKFDVIFLTDIIEHLYDEQLTVLFEKVKMHLSEKGVVVIHTMPTKEFIYFGQLLKWFLYLVKGKKHHLLTFKSQAEITHVNLQHKEQLARHLSKFDFKIWYDFADKSFFKNILGKTPLVRLLSGNLWAIAKLK